MRFIIILLLRWIMIFLLLEMLWTTEAFLLPSSSSSSGCSQTAIPIRITTSTTTTRTTTRTELYGFRSFVKRKIFRRTDTMEKKKNYKVGGGEGSSSSSISSSSSSELSLSTTIASSSSSSSSSATTMLEEEDQPINSNSSSSSSSSQGRRRLEDDIALIEMERETFYEVIEHTGAVILSRSTNSPMDMFYSHDDDDELDEPFSLPEPTRMLSKLELEFRNMLLDFSQFTKRDIQSVKDTRMRTIYMGVAASYDIPEVYRAFEVLFEDILPLRIAGRLIYGKLKQYMIESQMERKQTIEELISITDLSKEEIEKNHIAFLQLVIHHDNDDDDNNKGTTEMDIQKLVDTGIAETIVEVLGYSDFDDFLSVLQLHHTQDKIGFCDLMVGLQNCSIDNPKPECNPATVLPEVIQRLNERRRKQQQRNSSNDDDPQQQQLSSISGSSDQRKQGYIEKYELMVSQFLEWKDFVIPPPNDDDNETTTTTTTSSGGSASSSRRFDVLRGCFVGAESPEIVNALRIVYVDYSALRTSGDLIFKLMSAIVESKKKKEKERIVK